MGDVKPVLEILAELKRKGTIEAYYSNFSLLEAVAKAAELGVPDSVLEYGVASIVSGYMLAEPDAKAWLIAAGLRRDGLRDFIDAILYATALTSNLRFLTMGYSLVKFLEEHGYPTNIIVTGKDLTGAKRME